MKCAECGVSLPAATPLYATQPDPDADTWVGDVRQAAADIGMPLMDHQDLIARVLCELRPDGTPRYNTVLVTIPRQQGKTTLSKAAQTAKARRTRRGRLYATAQSRMDARDHLEDLGLLLEETHPEEVKWRAGIGTERLAFDNKAWIKVIAPNKAGGHGPSIDFLLIDELWAVQSHVLQGARPAMAARPSSQMLLISTMGTLESDVLNRLVKMGREAITDPTSRMAYFEWAAPDNDAVFDESRWHDFMPALGVTVSHDTIRADRDFFLAEDFIRAYGNRLTRTKASVFPSEWVEKAWRLAIPPPDAMILGVDVNDDPAGATITSTHLDVDAHASIRTIEWRHGSPSWVPDKVSEVCQRRTVDAIAADLRGPARAIQAELKAVADDLDVPIVDRRPADVGGDTAAFYDGLRTGTLSLEKGEPLIEAIAGSERKSIGDLWVVSRRASRVDVSPVIAAIVGYGVTMELHHEPRLFPAFY